MYVVTLRNFMRLFNMDDSGDTDGEDRDQRRGLATLCRNKERWQTENNVQRHTKHLRDGAMKPREQTLRDGFFFREASCIPLGKSFVQTALLCALPWYQLASNSKINLILNLDSYSLACPYAMHYCAYVILYREVILLWSVLLTSNNLVSRRLNHT